MYKYYFIKSLSGTKRVTREEYVKRRAKGFSKELKNNKKSSLTLITYSKAHKR